MRYEIVGLEIDQARRLADELCGSALFVDGHAWVNASCVVRPQGCQCPHCRILDGRAEHPTGDGT